jgi:NADPH:quinone reductase-like Zn-dependent oxidoreductase
VRIFVAGGTGVLGVRLVPLLVDAGHDVVATTRTPAKAALLTDLGATPVVCDVYDRERLIEVAVAAQPDLVMHQLTDLPDNADDLGPDVYAANARIRTEGTDNLLAAASAANTSRFVAQSIAWRASDPTSVEHLEHAVLDFGGVVLRYGQFHGPGTWMATADDIPDDGAKVSVDHAATATVAHLTSPTGIYTVVD